MPCLICAQDIAPTERIAALPYVGDTVYERGRYAVHGTCMRAQWRKVWVTPEMLWGKNIPTSPYGPLAPAPPPAPEPRPSVWDRVKQVWRMLWPREDRSC